MKEKAGQKLTVSKLIAILKRCKHKRTAIVTFEVEKHIPAEVDLMTEAKTIDVEYDIERLGQFGVVPDVMISLQERKPKDYT